MINPLPLPPLHPIPSVDEQTVNDCRTILTYLELSGRDLTAEEIRAECELTLKRWNRARVVLLDARNIGRIDGSGKFCLIHTHDQ